MEMGTTYFIKTEGMDIFKIGYCCNDLDKRIALIRLGNPYRLTYFGFINSLSARSVEESLHKLFAKYRMNGEWFGITSEQATDALRKYGGVLVEPSYRGKKARVKQPLSICAEVSCGKPTYRTNQRYCSDVCRQKAHRDRQRAKKSLS